MMLFNYHEVMILIFITRIALRRKLEHLVSCPGYLCPWTVVAKTWKILTHHFSFYHPRLNADFFVCLPLCYYLMTHKFQASTLCVLRKLLSDNIQGVDIASFCLLNCMKLPYEMDTMETNFIYMNLHLQEVALIDHFPTFWGSSSSSVNYPHFTFLQVHEQ